MRRTLLLILGGALPCAAAAAAFLWRPATDDPCQGMTEATGVQAGKRQAVEQRLLRLGIPADGLWFQEIPPGWTGWEIPPGERGLTFRLLASEKKRPAGFDVDIRLADTAEQLPQFWTLYQLQTPLPAVDWATVPRTFALALKKADLPAGALKGEVKGHPHVLLRPGPTK